MLSCSHSLVTVWEITEEEAREKFCLSVHPRGSGYHLGLSQMQAIEISLNRNVIGFLKIQR